MFESFFQSLLNRPTDSHKYMFGHVLVIGGSPGMVGAPLLTAKAALRSGAGLVTIASTSEVIDNLEAKVPEVMTLRLSIVGAHAAEELKAFMQKRKVTVLTVGCGMEPSEQNHAMLSKLIADTRLPIVLDGGALAMLADTIAQLQLAASKQIILTPHLGEFERLAGQKLPTSRESLKSIAIQFARRHKVTLVVKGMPTFVVQPDGELYENMSGTPGLATAGSGDVLSGVIAALVAQEPGSPKAVEAAVYLHGLAGESAAAAKTQVGMIASDVIKHLPLVLKSL